MLLKDTDVVIMRKRNSIFSIYLFFFFFLVNASGDVTITQLGWSQTAESACILSVIQVGLVMAFLLTPFFLLIKKTETIKDEMSDFLESELLIHVCH